MCQKGEERQLILAAGGLIRWHYDFIEEITIFLH